MQTILQPLSSLDNPFIGKSMRRHRWAAVALLLSVLGLAPLAPAMADGNLSIAVNTDDFGFRVGSRPYYARPATVMVQRPVYAAPVYVQPQQVIYRQAPVYVQPAPVSYYYRVAETRPYYGRGWNRPYDWNRPYGPPGQRWRHDRDDDRRYGWGR